MNNNMDIVVLISGNGSNLQALIHRQRIFGFNIAGVISSRPDAYGLIRAERSGIPVLSLNHHLYASREAFDTALACAVDSFNPSLVVLSGFMRILTPSFTQRYYGRLINIHPSLLPKYKGLHTHRRVLEEHDKIHGTTVHFVNENLDDGAAIIQGKTEVLSTDTEASLRGRIQKIEHRIYPLAVSWFIAGRLRYRDGKTWLDNESLPETGYDYAKYDDEENDYPENGYSGNDCVEK